jgi:aerobic carbon-monoxide dehydrogenase large subunit
LTGSFMDYAMPRAADVPSFAVADHGVPTKTNPLGVKGVGEAGTLGAIPAVLNAVNDALAQAGSPPVDMPATSEKVWRALRLAAGDA